MNSQIAICKFKKHNYKYALDCVEDMEFSDSEYSYLTDITDLKDGDIVVVDTKYGLEIARFIKYSNSLADRKLADRWVVQTINISEFVMKQANREQKELLLEQMRYLRDTAMELEMFQTLAKSNTQLAELLQQYNNLDNLH